MLGFSLPLRAGLALLFLGVAAVGPALADDDQIARLKDALRDTVSALRDAQDQNAALTAKQTELTAQIAAEQQTIDSLKAQQAGSATTAGQLADVQASAKQTGDQLAQTQAALQKWEDAYNKLLTLAKSRDAAARDYQARYGLASSQLGQCTSKNNGLEKLGTEMLGKVGHCSFGDFLGAHEPITQIYRARLETLTDGYADKLQDDAYPPK